MEWLLGVSIIFQYASGLSRLKTGLTPTRMPLYCTNSDDVYVSTIDSLDFEDISRMFTDAKYEDVSRSEDRNDFSCPYHNSTCTRRTTRPPGHNCDFTITQDNDYSHMLCKTLIRVGIENLIMTLS